MQIKLGVEPDVLKFDKASFTVKAGRKVVLTFTNNGNMLHNVLILKPGTLQKVGMLANAMAADPQGMEKGYLPESADILHHSPLVAAGGKATLRFTAPLRPGDYPYVCTFPGHWLVMNGTMKVIP